MAIDFEDFKKRRVEGAIVAFIRGKKNMNWVMGIIKCMHSPLWTLPL